MRKLSLIIIAFTLVLFTQCKKEKIAENTGDGGRMVPITLELPVDNGAKTDFGSFLTDADNPQGTIKWSDGDIIYLAVPNLKLKDPETGYVYATKEFAQMIKLTGELQANGLIKFNGNVDRRVLTENTAYNLYYFGNSDGIEEGRVQETKGIIGGGQTGEEVTLTGEEVTLGVKLFLNGQDGSRANLGDYHFATLEGVHVHIEYEKDPNTGYQVAKSYAIHTNYPYFTTQVAIAYLDFTGLTETEPAGEGSGGFYLYGNNASVQMANSVEVAFNYDSNIYEIDYFTGAESQDDNLMYIKLSDNVKTKLVNGVPDPKSFIVLAPGVNSIRAYGVKDNGVGTYTFKNGGTKANSVYFTKNVSTDQILPLEWQ